MGKRVEGHRRFGGSRLARPRTVPTQPIASFMVTLCGDGEAAPRHEQTDDRYLTTGPAVGFPCGVHGLSGSCPLAARGMTRRVPPATRRPIIKRPSAAVSACLLPEPAAST